MVLIFYGFKNAHNVPEFDTGVRRHVGILKNFI